MKVTQIPVYLYFVHARNEVNTDLTSGALRLV